MRFLLRSGVSEIHAKRIRITHWSKSPLGSSRLVGKFGNHVEYTDFTKLMINFWDNIILCFIKYKILPLQVNHENDL